MKKRDTLPKNPTKGDTAATPAVPFSATPSGDSGATPESPDSFQKTKRGRPAGSTTRLTCVVCEKPTSGEGACTCQGGPYLEKPKMEINEPFFRYLMMMVSQFCAGGVALGMGVPYAEALRLWSFSPAECQNLYGPGHTVLEKWIPFWLVQFKDEIALAIVLMPILTVKMVATSQFKTQLEEAKRRAEQAAENGAPAPAPAKTAEVLQ